MLPSKIDENGKVFIDKKTKQCFDLIHKCSISRNIITEHINNVRGIMNLEKI